MLIQHFIGLTHEFIASSDSDEARHWILRRVAGYLKNLRISSRVSRMVKVQFGPNKIRYVESADWQV